MCPCENAGDYLWLLSGPKGGFVKYLCRENMVRRFLLFSRRLSLCLGA